MQYHFILGPLTGMHPNTKLGAALSIIRDNDGYKAVHNIFQSFSLSNPFIRKNEVFRLLDRKRFANRRNLIPWQDTFAGEHTNNAKLREQLSQYEPGYSSGIYSGAKSVV